MSTQSQTLPHPGSTPSNMNTSTGGTESAASTNFSADDAPVNEYGERRFVKKLSWFGPLNLATILACTIPTAATASMFSLMYTIALPEGPANAAIGQTNIAGAFIGAVFAVLIGHLSDITRTCMGRRNPWILGGAALATIGLIGMALANYSVVWSVILFFCMFQAGLNTVYAAYTALLPDRVHSRLLGRASAYSGFGSLAGTALGSIVTQVLVGIFGAPNLKQGFLLLPWLMVIMAICIVIVLPGADLRHKDLGVQANGEKKDTRFHLPKDRDYWLAYFGRFFIALSIMLVIQTATQILRYHFQLDVKGAAAAGAIAGLLMAGAGAVASLFAGYFTDKLGRRKPMIAVTVALFIVGLLLLIFSHNIVMYYVFTVFAALSYGGFQAVDQALMVEVLPSQANAAQDMGILGTTNTLTGVIAGAFGAMIIGALGYTALFITAAVCALIGIFIFVPIKRVK